LGGNSTVSYLVLARKYRPQTFDDVVGQPHITKTLQNSIAHNRVAHALLFTGIRGVGKTTVARILAKTLNCSSGELNPCNECQSCRAISAGNSVDVLEIDGASNTGVDDVRDIQDTIKYLPSEGKYKIYIIDEVHMLSISAFNAFLKTLEEPPKHVIFIFATTEVQKIPETVLSRCQRFDYKQVSAKQIFDRLVEITRREEISLNPEILMTIAKMADGSMRDSISLLDQVIAYAGNDISEKDINELLGLMDINLLVKLVRALLSHDAATSLAIIDQLIVSGYNIKHFCATFLEILRDITVYKFTAGKSKLMALNAERAKEFDSLLEGYPLENLNLLFHIFLQGIHDINHADAPKLILEMTILKMLSVKKTVPIEEALRKIEYLMSLGDAPAHSAKIPTRSPTPPEPELSRARPNRPPESGLEPMPVAPSEPTATPDTTSERSLSHHANETDSFSSDQAEASGNGFLPILRRIVDQLRQENRVVLATYLEQCGISSLTDDEIVFIFDPKSQKPVSASYLNDKEHMEIVRKVIRTVLAKDCHVRYLPSEVANVPNVQSLSKINDQKQQVQRQSIEDEIKSSATILALKQHFGAEIISKKFFS
jgi:DNA polymerase-3 subunit gamma/tau